MRTVDGSRVGPKSHGCCCLIPSLSSTLLFWLTVFSCFVHVHAASADARVAPIVRLGAGASGCAWGEATGPTVFNLFSLSFSTSGLQTTSPPGRHVQIRKRAYARAVRRAAQAPDGSTIYRGRRCVLRDQHRLVAALSGWHSSAPSGSRPSRRATRERLRTVTLNVGSLDATTFDTLMQWVPTAPFEVICLQEIHFGLGKESAQWIAAGWRFLTTVDASTRFQGVALLIRESLCHAGELHFQEVVAGRLLHVRVQRPHHAIDLVGIYQHALAQDADKHNQRQRHILWDKLGQQLHSLPQRNLLNIMGDFNCTPSFVQGSMGTA